MPGEPQVQPRFKSTADAEPKARKRIRPVSKSRQSKASAREACVAEVLTRPGPRCEMAHLIPEVECWSMVTPERPHEIEVDELRGGSYRVTEMYDPDRCQRGCHAHHDWKTSHKREYLRRFTAHLIRRSA